MSNQSIADTPASANQSASANWAGLFVLLLAGFMNFMDVTIVNVALPTLQKDLGASSSQIEWVVAGFVLAFALGLLPFGRLGDIIGRRNLFLAGIASFTLASALCGASTSIEMLIFARILQGISGAVMMPQVMAIIQAAFPPEKRGAAFGMFGLSAGLASVSGPVIGGLLIEANFFSSGWRMIFFVNIPIGLFAIFAGLRALPNRPGNSSLKMDWIGIILSVIAMLLIIFPLIEGRTYDWPIWCFVMLASSVVFFALFYLWENYRDRKGKTELLPVSLITNRNFLIGTAVVTFFFSGLPGFFMSIALFLQQGFDFTPLHSGLTTIPFPLGVLVASVISGTLSDKWLKPRLIGGLLILLAGMYFLRLTVTATTGTVDGLSFAPYLGMAGFGMGIAISAMFQTVLQGVPVGDAGSGSGALQALQQVGGALGVAMIGQIFFTTLSHPSDKVQSKADAFVEAMSNTTLYELAIFTLVILLALLLRPMRTVDQEAVPAEGIA